MKNLSVRDILEIPQFSFFINAKNFKNFFTKKSDAIGLEAEVARRTQSSVIDLINNNVIRELEIERSQTDNIVTKTSSGVIKEILIQNSKKINSSALMLQFAFMSKTFLAQIERAEKGYKDVNAEMAYANGDIVVIENGEISICSMEDTPRTISEIKSDLAEGILIANQYFSNERNKNLGVSGNYHESGINERTIRMSYSLKDLSEDARSQRVLKAFSKEKIVDLLNEKMISRGTLVRFLSSGVIDKNIAVDLMIDGVISKEEVISKIFKKSNIQGVALDNDTSFRTKLLLYSTGWISIDVLERGVKKYQEDTLDLTEPLTSISQYYKGNLNKISELLTHKVLDYSNSMKFLQILQDETQITSEERDYLEKVMSDFKIDELVNNTENGELVSTGGTRTSVSTDNTPYLTIDPERRINYLKSIGAVKKLKIRGEVFIKDSEENAGKRNSLDGYEVFIIPDKKIAVLEKLYEVTRDKNGNLSYKKDKAGNLIPAINNATYIMPIEMAKELAEKRNKSDLISSPYVRRANHTLDWVTNLEAKMRTINPNIKFEEKNTKYWSEFIRKNYQENLEKRSRD